MKEVHQEVVQIQQIRELMKVEQKVKELATLKMKEVHLAKELIQDTVILKI